MVTKVGHPRSSRPTIVPADDVAVGSAAERRQLTVLFVDVVDSTSLSESIDPEEFFGIIRDYQAVCYAQVRRYGGYIGTTIGDGLLAYFGLPHAHEDDSERAVHAALAITRALRERRFPTSEAGPVQLGIRIAVNTGTVVAGNLTGELGEKREIFGSSVNIAARLQGVAPINGVVIGTETHKLVRGTFRCTDLGEQDLRGVNHPVGAWCVDGVAESESRFERTRPSPLTPMINREAECAVLSAFWEKCTNGSGGVVLIDGDPGIGKSRLIKAFRETLPPPSVVTLALQCSPFDANTPLAPEIDRLRRATGIRKDDTPERMLSRLRVLLARASFDTEHALRYYGALLSIPGCNGYEPADLASTRGRELALKAVSDSLIAASRERPVLVVVEDVQWIDPTSVELLRGVTASIASERVLLLITCRSDHEPGWLSSLPAHRIHLHKLHARDSEQMAKAVAGAATMPRKILAKILERTDGVPLFIEEFTRAVLDSGAVQRVDDQLLPSGQLPEPLVPASLHDSLMERLDRLGHAKRIAQIASVFGRLFDYEGIFDLYPIQPESLLRGLEMLEAAGIVHRVQERGEGLFAFNHAMLQEVAYASLLKEERRELHARAAAWLRRGEPIAECGQPAVLGYHYSRAGSMPEAVEAWLHAGKSALRRAATKEAVAHLREGIALVARLPASPMRYEAEIALQSNLAMAYTAIAGWSDPKVYGAYARALELCRDYGTMREKSIVWWGIAIAKLVNCELKGSRNHAHEFLRLAKRWGDEEAVLMAQTAMLVANFFSGNLLEARKRAELICKRYDRRHHGKLVQIYEHDPKIVALVYLGHIEWLLGRPGKARARCEAARTLATQIGHPFMLAFTKIIGVSDHWYDHNLAANLKSVEEGIKVAEDYGYPMYRVIGPLWATSAMVERGPAVPVLQHLCDLLTKLPAEDRCIQVPLYKIMLAAEFARIGEVERGRSLAVSAEPIMRRTGERWYEPEVYRIRAHLARLDPDGDHQAALRLYRRSLSSARRLKAIGWELRTAIDLARLLSSDGKRSQARVLLKRVLNRFPAGETSADIRDGSELLRRLTN